MKYQNNWHLRSSDDVLRELSVDMYKGLPREDVKKRRRKYGSNSVWQVKRTSASDVVMATVFDLATLILVISVVFAAAFDKKYEAGAIALILVLGGILRAVTYVRASRILEDIAGSKIPSASVIRDGKESLVSASEIVVGDIVFLDSGDTVPCDGRVLTGDDSVVSERGITENKTPVHKFNTIIETEAADGEVPCEFRSNMLFAGSSVISGPLRMVVTACGEDTLISMKAGGIEIKTGEKIPVIVKLGVRSRNTSLVMLACVMLFTVLSVFSGESSLSDVFLCTMSMAVAAMSEFLTTIGYIIIAVTLRDSADEAKAEKTGSSRAVIRDPEIIEKLASIERVVFCGTSFFKSGRAEILAYRSSGKYVGIDEEYPENNSPERLLSLALSASASLGTGMASGAEKHIESKFSGFIKKAADAYFSSTGKRISNTYLPLDHVDSSSPMSSGLDTSLVAIGNITWAVSCGSVDDVIRCCSTCETDGGTADLTDELKRLIFTECARLEFGGAKVIAVAMRQSPINSLNRISMLTQYMRFVGFFAVSQEQEKNAAENALYLKKSGIIPIVFTENPDSDLYYCHRLKIFNKKTKIINASDLTREIVDSIDKNGAIISFEGVEPSYIAGAYSRAMKTVMGIESDKRSDSSKQKSGEKTKITAALGCETYESGVVAKADIGISVTQSEFRSVPEILAKNSSVVIHTSSDTFAENGGLDGLVSAVKASRRALSNIDSAKLYLTASQCARLVLILAAVLFKVPLISAVFILIWGLIFDFAAVLVMAFENRNDPIPIADKDEEDDFRLLSEPAKKTIRSVLYGILWGAVLSGLVPISEMISPGITGGLTALSAAVIFSVLAASVGIAKRGCIDLRGQHSSVASGIFAAVSVLFALVLMFTGFGADIANGNICKTPALIPALIPAILVFLVICIYKAASNRSSKKYINHKNT